MISKIFLYICKLEADLMIGNDQFWYGILAKIKSFQTKSNTVYSLIYIAFMLLSTLTHWMYELTLLSVIVVLIIPLLVEWRLNPEGALDVIVAVQRINEEREEELKKIKK